VDFAFTSHGGIIRPLQIRSEILRLLEKIKPSHPKYVLEIGTCNGGTLLLLSQVAREDARIISVDLPLGLYGGGYPAWKCPFYQSFARKGQTIHLIRADSHVLNTREKVVSILQNQQLDLLFIDADHSYEGVKRDFEMYFPLVREGGAVILHDIAPHSPGSNCGVDQYWNEVKAKYEHIEFIEDCDQHGAGLGLIVKGGGGADTNLHAGEMKQ
jgi:predicted O-methyltransferase YrrM